MKILDIRLKNLNSLRGEWHIDLTDKIYTSDGIFAITGPTGAGKTTIFDAVCLALYGHTPRLGKITGTNNEIMTRRTNECYAQVIFEVNGAQYISSWQQHKINSKKFQPIKHLLSESSGKIISDKSDDARKRVETITGLDFKRFTQAVMLEQGGFDAFLKANAGDRSQILEALTGTEIYSKISHEVYERYSAEKITLDKLKFSLSGKKPNDNYSSEEEITQELTRTHSRYSQLEAEHEKVKSAFEWLRKINRLKYELSLTLHDITQHEKRIDNFSQQRTKLDAASRANELAVFYSTLMAARSNVASTKSRCEILEHKISQDKAALSEIETKNLPDIQKNYNRKTRDIANSPDVVMNEIKSLAKNFITLQHELNITISDGKRFRDIHSKSQVALKSAEHNDSRCRESHTEAMKKLSDLMNMRASAILDDARRNLQPGVPCPVCGSVEHPAANHDDNSCGKSITNLDDELKVLRDHENSARQQLEQATGTLTQARTNEGIARTKLENCRKLYLEKAKSVDIAKMSLCETLKPLGIYKVDDIDEVMKNVRKWYGEITALDDKIRALNDKAAALKIQIETNSKNLLSERAGLEKISCELEKSEQDFEAMLNEKNFASEEIFNASIVDDRELDNLQFNARHLDDETNRLQTVRAEREGKYNEELSRAVTNKTLEEIEPLFHQQELMLKATAGKIGRLEKILEDRKNFGAELEELQAHYKSQERVYLEWSALNGLIGTNNGNKFRKFAQRMTLSTMIKLANVQLEKMSGRYTLTANPDDEDLNLFVVDNEQAGEIRPTENLSGGERFIVSLALALGLSQISGNNARVDSLFLDEGFGSLDEDALNTALEALGEVRREGRMIGIISHVQALKDRIAAQINVIPKNEGISILEGPGCSKL